MTQAGYAQVDKQSLAEIQKLAEQGDEAAIGSLRQKFQISASQGDPAAQYEMGRMYSQGDWMPKDKQKAVYWYQKAAKQGSAEAQYNLGMMYYQGDGVTQDFQTAFKWFKKAAEQGHAKAQQNLAAMTQAGHVQADERSLAEIEKAAEQGEAEAQFNLGLMYYQGDGVTQDYQKAYEWFQKAAEQGSAVAQTNLGVMYYQGDGVTQDYQKAYEWFQKAAEQGLTRAQYYLGVLNAQGEGVAKDSQKAFEWYQKAAEQGEAEAQFNLGLMYYQGDGVTQDYQKAYEWIQKAAEQGFARAQYWFLAQTQGKTFTNSFGIEFVLIPAGGEISKPFYMGKYEVTQEQWEKGMIATLQGQMYVGQAMATASLPAGMLDKQDGPSNYPELQALVDRLETLGVNIYRALNPSTHKGKNHPVESVKATEIDDYIKALNEIEIKESKNRRGSYRLPRVPEWEHAARAGSATEWFFGNNPEDLAQYGWLGDIKDWPNEGKLSWTWLGVAGSPHPVGQKKANPWGLYDLFGNVAEKMDNGAWRGCFWAVPAEECLSTYVRDDEWAGQGYMSSDVLGFRLVFVPDLSVAPQP
jgi:TPR repeat protein